MKKLFTILSAMLLSISLSSAKTLTGKVAIGAGKGEVSFEPKKGYAIKSIDAAFLWQDPTGGDPEEKAGFGFKATDTDSTLVINPRTMAGPGMYFEVVYVKAGPFYVTYDLNPIDNLGNDWSNNIYLPRGAQKTVEFTDEALKEDNVPA